ncbi:MAG: hypothetical protein M3Q81_01005 [bacterium]|nr:hypothetical protein [bacterium]
MLSHTATKYSYATIIFLLAVQVLFTVYSGSKTVHLGQRITLLEKQRQTLTARSIVLQSRLAQSQSLANVQALPETQQYQLIAKPLTLTHTGSVALR